VHQVMQQGMGHPVGVRIHEHRRARHPHRGRHFDAVDKGQQLQGFPLQPFRQQLAAPLPGGHHDEHRHPHHQGEPATVGNLHHIGGQEGKFHHQEASEEGDGPGPAPAPHPGHHGGSQQGGNDHVPGYRNTVSRRQVIGGFEAQHQHRHGTEQAPVHPGQVNLALFLFRGVLHFHTGHKA